MRASLRDPAFLVLLCLSASIASAQTSPRPTPNPTSPWDKPNPDSVWDKMNPAVTLPWTGPSPVGDWIVEWRDVPERGRVVRAPVTIFDARTLQCTKTADGGCRLAKVIDRSAAWRLWAIGHTGGSDIPRTSRGGMLTFQHPYFFPIEHGETRFGSTGDNQLVGQLTRGGQEFPVVFRRSVPRVTLVRLISSVTSDTAPGGSVARVKVGYDADYWASASPSYVPRFTVEVYGDNMWGFHFVHFPHDVDIVTGDMEPILRPDAPDRTAGNIIGFRVPVWVLGVRPGAKAEAARTTPGRKTLVIDDDLEVPIDVDIVGFPGAKPESKLLTLRYVEERSGKFVPVESDLVHGTVFYVEAAFDTPPGANSYAVSLDWVGSAPRQVTVTPTAEATVYRSGPIRLRVTP